MPHPLDLPFEDIRTELEQVVRLLDDAIASAADAPEVWRLHTARDTLVGLRKALARADLSAGEKFGLVAPTLRGIFRGWADSPPEFVIPEDVHKRLLPLYEQALPRER